VHARSRGAAVTEEFSCRPPNRISGFVTLPLSPHEGPVSLIGPLFLSLYASLHPKGSGSHPRRLLKGGYPNCQGSLVDSNFLPLKDLMSTPSMGPLPEQNVSRLVYPSFLLPFYA